MVTRGRKARTVRFAVTVPDGRHDVYVAGEFSGWEPVRMTRRPGGTYVRQVAAPAGTFEYKFLVDGQWLADPDNPYRAPDPYGGFNSVAAADADVAGHG
ncbi:MAG: hypothetical protein GX591_10325 [Planctomycetes bacterium]|nr:hypothetical protein [Planctomycetota bacterium]